MPAATKSKKKTTTTDATTMPEPTPISGYRPRARYREITVPVELIDIEEGGEPFTATIRSHLTFGEIEAIPYGQGVRYTDIEEAIAPYVVRWNVLAVNEATGQLEPVPAPAAAGPDAFKAISGFEVEWLAIELRKTSVGSAEALYRKERDGVITAEEADQKKGWTPSGPMPEPVGSSS